MSDFDDLDIYTRMLYKKHQKLVEKEHLLNSKKREEFLRRKAEYEQKQRLYERIDKQINRLL